MPPVTYPNQRIVRVHRERAAKDFLGIKNENWMAASRVLGATALRLYLYLAANADNYTFALSPAAITRDIGMARSTYTDQFKVLVNMGYLVPATGNTYDFYEVPQTAAQTRNITSAGGQDFEDCPRTDSAGSPGGHTVLPEDREINNNTITPNKELINNGNPVPEETTIYVPKVKEITIPRPKAEGKERPKPVQEPKQMEFVF